MKQGNPKQRLKRAALVLALALLAGLLVFANGAMGNPISKALAKQAAAAYLEEQYAGQNLFVEDCGYSFKDGHYYVRVAHRTSRDTYFTVYADGAGRVLRDSYELQVAGHYNTYLRVLDDYRRLTDTALESLAMDPDFSAEIEFGGGMLIFYETSPEEWAENYDFALPMEALELDKEYSTRALGQQAGVLNLYVMTEELSPEYAARLAQLVRTVCEECGASFRFLDMVLRHPKPLDDTPRNAEEYYVRLHWHELADDDGLLDRVQQSHEARAAYFAALDAENARELG